MYTNNKIISSYFMLVATAKISEIIDALCRIFIAVDRSLLAALCGVDMTDRQLFCAAVA